MVTPAAYAGGGTPFTSFVYPLLGTRVSSEFGTRKHPVRKVTRHHNGVDLAAPEGATIRAIQEGLVVYADPYGSYGNLIVIEHKDGLSSHYGHCSSIDVKTGMRVKTGAVIGTVGKTGTVTGAHLHFELRKNGAALNPEDFLPGLADVAEG
jgi:murein DD-endopeptidase MepM/ murein hydrolase activator NlpD